MAPKPALSRSTPRPLHPAFLQASRYPYKPHLGPPQRTSVEVTQPVVVTRETQARLQWFSLKLLQSLEETFALHSANS